MKLLLDTQLLLLAASQPDRLTLTALRLIRDPENDLFFSVASLWEITTKASAERPDLLVDTRRLRRGLIDNGYEEIAVTGAHVAAMATLPARHADPFDRMLVAQAMVEDLTLLTLDTEFTGYPGSIRRV
ncbi:MAG: type II toxin-antitoxin system VapC family toxin [Sphingomonas sp.]|nr:type II toxin-antitoxin system VapC family toxin [Sphingomonas sp.]